MFRERLLISDCPCVNGYPDEIRKQVLFFTAAIVTLTLLLNATTVRWLLGRLGLTGQHSASFIDYSLHERENTLLYFEKLRKRDMLAGADWEHVSSYLPSPVSKPMIETTSDIVSAIRLRLQNKEKQLSAQLCTEGIISVDTLRSLTVSTDDLFDHDGNRPLNNRKSIVNHFSGPMYIRLFRSTHSSS